MPKRKTDRDGLYRRGDSPYWWASYTDASGKRARRSTGTADKREAQAILGKWKVEAHRQEHWDEQPSRTFDELMLAFLEETMHRRRTGQRRVKVAVRPLYRAFSGVDISALRVADIRGYIRERRDQGRAASTINKEIGLLSAAINHARREWGWDIPNPAQGQRLSEPAGRVRWITRAESIALILAAEAEPKAPHLADIITLALHTGMRRGEILGLEWSRVDLQADLIHLGEAHTKAGKRRTVPMNRVARQAILNRARYRAEHYPGSPWVFINQTGDPIQDIKRSFATACKRAEIQDFRFHDLRHTCAAWLVTEGVPLAEVRDLLGHASIQMTERYAHLAPENIRHAVAKLEGASSRLSHVSKLKAT